MPPVGTPEIRELATGLSFPEGPVARADESVVVVEIRRGTLTRVTADGKVEVVAELGGGPNGVAIGPDDAAYVANNGGFVWSEIGDITIPVDLATGNNEPPDYSGGRVERVDLTSGEVRVLYTECDGRALRGPNDLVFDEAGGFWFTDFGKTRPREMDRGGLYYATPDGRHVRQAAYGMHGPNGVGLSPDGGRVYVAETYTGRLLAWDLDGPGRLRRSGLGAGGHIVVTTKSHFDSLAVEDDGTVVVAALPDGLCVVRPDGEHHYVALPDALTTNVCFGGADRCTAFVTMSGSGRLVALDWPRPGLRLAYG